MNNSHKGCSIGHSTYHELLTIWYCQDKELSLSNHKQMIPCSIINYSLFVYAFSTIHIHYRWNLLFQRLLIEFRGGCKTELTIWSREGFMNLWILGYFRGFSFLIPNYMANRAHEVFVLFYKIRGCVRISWEWDFTGCDFVLKTSVCILLCSWCLWSSTQFGKQPTGVHRSLF